ETAPSRPSNPAPCAARCQLPWINDGMVPPPRGAVIPNANAPPPSRAASPILDRQMGLWITESDAPRVPYRGVHVAAQTDARYGLRCAHRALARRLHAEQSDADTFADRDAQPPVRLGRGGTQSRNGCLRGVLES